MPLPTGKMIKDRYLINRVISTQGGFGNTYLAHDTLRGQEIVIKESKTAADIEQDALLCELRILQSLDHPRLPKVYDGFFHEGQLCVTMQYIPGRDVSTYLVMSGQERRADPPDRPTALRWIAQTLDALAYLHGRNIVHRDVKPSNLRVHTETGDIFLLDFGIAHQVEHALIRAHSPRYSPPEQHDPAGITTPASDIYAVGATLYLLLTGLEPPYRDDHNDKTMRLMTEERQTIPVELENVVIRAMRFDAADRYPNAQAMLSELQRLGYVPRLTAATIPFHSQDDAAEQPDQDASRAVRTIATITAPTDMEESGPAPALLWGLGATGLALLAAVAFMLTLVLSPRQSPALSSAATPALTVGGGTQVPAPDPMLAASAATPESAAAPLPSAITGEAAILLATAGHAPSATAMVAITATATPAPYLIRQIDVLGQPDNTAIYVGKLPAQITLLGERLDMITSVTLQPKTPGQRTIILSLLQSQSGRIDFAITSLPTSFRTGEYDLLINGQPDRSIMLRDYLREVSLQSITMEYRYLAAIRPFPSTPLNGKDIPGPFALLYPQPDPSLRGAYMRNGDLIAILDDTSNPDFYKVRVKENFDPALAGREGWMWGWVVENAPPAPPSPGAIQMPYNIRGERRETVIEWLRQRGVPSSTISVDYQTRERIPDVFDRFKADEIVSAEPIEGSWIAPGATIILGVRAP